MSVQRKQAGPSASPTCHCLEQAGLKGRREILRTAGRAAALVGMAWLGGGMFLRSWNTPEGTACRLAAACGDCAERARCEYPEIREARRAADGW